MKKLLTLVVLSLMLIEGGSAEAQRHKKSSSHRFDFSIHGGASLSQIDGDGSGHYDKAGFQFGVNTSFPIGESENWRFQIETGFVQKGSHVNNIDRYINLMYVEVPLMINYNTQEGKLRLGAGIAPAILVKSKVTTNDVYDAPQSENYKRLDPLPVCLEARYLFGNHLGAGIRYYNSMLNVAKESGSGTYRIFRSNKGQFNRLLTVGVYLTF